MQEPFKSAYELSVELNEVLEGFSIDNNDNLLFPVLFHSTVIEHHRSIILLAEKSLYSSASNLLRSLLRLTLKVYGSRNVRRIKISII